MRSKNSWVPIYVVLGVVWGCSFVFIKSGLDFLSPVGVAFFRCALGAITLYSYARFKGISLPRNRVALIHIWVVSLLLNVIPGIFYALAETVVTSVLAAILNAVTPLMTVLAILLINREEKPALHQLFGLSLGFLGVLTVLGAWAGLGDNPLWAILILLFAVTCYGVTFPYTRRFVMPLQIKSEAIVATQLICAALTLFPIYLLSGISITALPVVSVISMLALGVFGSGFAYLWNFRIMQLAGSAIASSVTYLTPLVAVIVGVLFLSEKVTWNEPVGALVVLLGAAIAQERISLKPKIR